MENTKAEKKMEVEDLIEFTGKLTRYYGTEMLMFHSKDGTYIGGIDELKNLILKRGIVPQSASLGKNKVCSIGKSVLDNKWYGWSHRAIFGFEIGDVVKEGDCCASSGLTNDYLKDHPEGDTSLIVGFKAETEEDCKKMAIAFADSVS
jgi:hypothetical protein